MPDGTQTSSSRRARRWFWILLVVAVVASGTLSSALAASPGPVAGIGVALSGLILAMSVALAARVMVAIDRASRRAAQSQILDARQTLNRSEKEG